MRPTTLMRHATLAASCLLGVLACGSDVDDDTAAGGAGQGGSAGGLGGSPPVYGIVDTDQRFCYGTAEGMTCSDPGESRHGQDAQNDGWQPSYTDNGDGTVTDNVTGLMWQQDPGAKMSYADAVAGAASFDLGGHDDWRLPNAKERQSIVDYSRSPDTTSSAAIDPVFAVSSITNEGGQEDYPFFWSSSTHATWTGGGHYAAYVCFGRCLGHMNGSWMDVHGAGAQRSDPKAGDPADYPEGHGPQGDAIRINNHVRCVRGMAVAGDPGTGGGGVGGGGTGGSGGGESPGPTPCTEQAECEVAGACPDDAALACSCESVPDGMACIPQCSTVADCPEPPPGMTFACSGEGLCVPQ